MTTQTAAPAPATRAKIDQHGIEYGVETTRSLRGLPANLRRLTAGLFIGRQVDIDYYQPGTNVLLRMEKATVEGVGIEQGGAWRDMLAVTMPPSTNDLGRMVFVSLATVARISTR